MHILYLRTFVGLIDSNNRNIILETVNSQTYYTTILCILHIIIIKILKLKVTNNSMVGTELSKFYFLITTLVLLVKLATC